MSGAPSPSPSPPSLLTGPLASSLLAFAVFLLLASPGPGWQDSGELILGARSLGIAHPPGEPLWILLGHLATVLPGGDLSFRLTLLSAGAGAVAVGCVHALARGSRSTLASEGGGALAAALAAGILALQSVRVELYSLQAALLLGALLLLGGRERLSPSRLGLAVLAWGLAVANHHALAIAASPGLLLLAIAHAGGSPSEMDGDSSKAPSRTHSPLPLQAFALSAGVALLLTTGLWLFLPIRGAASPALLWEDPTTWKGFLHLITAAEYRRSFSASPDLVGNGARHLFVLVEALSRPGLLLAAFGLWVRFRSSPLRGLGWLLMVAGMLATTLLQGVYDDNNPDALGYHATPFCLIAALAGQGLTMLLGSSSGEGLPLQRVARVMALPLALLTAVLSLPGAWSKADQRNWQGSRLLGRAVLASLPTGARLEGEGDAWVLPLLTLARAEGYRPDLFLPRVEPPLALSQPTTTRYIPGPWPFALRPSGLLAESFCDPIGERSPVDPVSDALSSLWISVFVSDSGNESPAWAFLARTARGRASLHIARGQMSEAARVLRLAADRDPDPRRMIHLEAYTVGQVASRLTSTAAAGSEPPSLLASLLLGEDSAFHKLASLPPSPLRDALLAAALPRAGWWNTAPDPNPWPSSPLLTGLRLLQAGHPQEALPSLTAEATTHPDDPIAVDALARASLALGDAPAAAAAWKRLLEARPGWPTALQGMDKLRGRGVGESP